MSVRGATALVFAAMAVVGLSACHDGAGKRTETTQIRITGTPKADPKAGQVAPARHDADKPADDATPTASSAAGSKGQSGVGAGPSASRES